MADDKILIDEKEVAKIIGMSKAWLRKKRYGQEGDGIPCMRIGRSVRYRRADVVAWVDLQVRQAA